MVEEEFLPTDQHVEQAWETPSHEEIISLTKTHVEAVEITDDDLVWVQAGMEHILLTTIGRKTGILHKVALPTWKDSNEERIIAHITNVTSPIIAVVPNSFEYSLKKSNI